VAPLGVGDPWRLPASSESDRAPLSQGGAACIGRRTVVVVRGVTVARFRRSEVVASPRAIVVM
jgi:hypothetical protein